MIQIFNLLVKGKFFQNEFSQYLGNIFLESVLKIIRSHRDKYHHTLKQNKTNKQTKTLQLYFNPFGWLVQIFLTRNRKIALFGERPSSFFFFK